MGLQVQNQSKSNDYTILPMGRHYTTLVSISLISMLLSRRTGSCPSLGCHGHAGCLPGVRQGMPEPAGEAVSRAAVFATERHSR